MYKIKRTIITNDCAQYLPPTFGKCNRFHGHTYIIKDLIIKTSKIVDFSLIKKTLESFDHLILAPLKHKPFWEAVQTLRDTTYGDDDTLPQFKCYYMDVEETTVEAIGAVLKEKIFAISDGIVDVQFELYETPKQCAIIDEET